MTSFPLMLSSLSRCFPMSSVSLLGLRPPPAPPPESPAPPTPPEPPDPPDPPDPEISSSPGKSHTHPLLLLHLTIPQRFHFDFEPPSPPPSRLVPPCRKSTPLPIAAISPHHSSRRPSHRMLHIPCFSNVNLGFYCLGQKWVECLLGLKLVTCLLGQKLRAFFLGASGLTPTPLDSFYRALSGPISLDMIYLIETRLFLNFAVSEIVCSSSGSITIPPIPFAQVCSCYSLSDSSTLGSYWMIVDSVALALWNSGLGITLSSIVDSRGSTFVLSGTFIALVRPFTAICSPFTATCSLYFGLTLLGVALLQIGQSFLSSFTVPVFLVRRGFHSPHPSFTELTILPYTSLVFSVIGIGSLGIKTVLLEAEARFVVQDGSCSAFVDGLTSEALFPPPCGFGKDYRFEDVRFSALVAEVFTTDSIEVFSDSQVLISSIKTKASSKELKAILHNVTCVSDESLKSLSFHFVPRLRNVVVDSIAKSALVAANSSSFNGV